MRRITFFSVTLAIVTVSAGLKPSPSRESPVHEVQVVAKQFAFEPQEIRVRAGESVRLVLRSDDRGHGFAIRDLKIDAQIPGGGEPVTVDFTAPPAGRYEITCSEFCGRGHGQMKAALVSVAATPTGQ